MCLAIPAKVVKIEKDRAVVDFGGVRREVMLTLVENARVGDYVIVHTGYAIQVMDEEEAEATLKLWEEILESESKLA